MAHLKDRYRIVPQMQDYDNLSSHWRPYIMFFNQSNISMPSISTDNQGFRYTIGKQGPYAFKQFEHSTQDKGIVLGGSTVFGVGATQDRYTLASQLNNKTALEWYNFGGRAFNSTQELILFLLYAPFNIKKLVLFSGINNLSICRQLHQTSAIFPPFYFQSRFEKGMSLEADEVLGIKYRLFQLIHEITNKCCGKSQASMTHQRSLHIIDTIERFERDMKILKALSLVHGFELFFFFQPFAGWINKKFTKEERQIFDILDQCTILPAELSSRQDPRTVEYINGIKRVCQTQGIFFKDLNETQEFLSNQWLFVDRVHLTDAGHHVAASIIEQFSF